MADLAEIVVLDHISAEPGVGAEPPELPAWFNLMVTAALPAAHSSSSDIVRTPRVAGRKRAPSATLPIWVTNGYR
ncbi:hypothetical protein ACGFSI_40390 [Streptomyces virginiae]|uniref:hypothetical protein n=1 Tax=Streptomyces virginiae TaxID=1961 RepID=UPI003714C067